MHLPSDLINLDKKSKPAVIVCPLIIRKQIGHLFFSLEATQGSEEKQVSFYALKEKNIIVYLFVYFPKKKNLSKNLSIIYKMGWGGVGDPLKFHCPHRLLGRMTNCKALKQARCEKGFLIFFPKLLNASYYCISPAGD